MLALALAAFALFRVLGDGLAHHPTHEAVPARWSMLAVGDTGRVHRAVAQLVEGQLAVAHDMASEDRAHPVDALLLLGDNFYMRGLRREELVERVRMNVVLPYCDFVELSGPRSLEVAGACPRAGGRRSRRPVWVVLGNHDRASPESPALERDAVPAFVSNWHLPAGFVHVVETGAGVSLVLFDSTLLETGDADPAALADALRAARGPFRILVSHAPSAVDKRGAPPRAGSVRGDFAQRVASAITAAGVHVQLHLSGHQHNLQLIDGDPGLGPALHVVAGSGARFRAIPAEHPRRRFASRRLGFARVDLVGEGAQRRLVVSLFESPDLPLLRFGGARLAARVAVGSDGEIVDLR